MKLVKVLIRPRFAELKTIISHHSEQRNVNLFMFSIKAKVVDWKYLQLFFFLHRPNCNYFLLPFFSSFMYPRVFFLLTVDCRVFSSLYSQGRRWWKKTLSLMYSSRPVTRIFSPSALFFSFLYDEKNINKKSYNVADNEKFFFSLFFHFIQQGFSSHFHRCDFN